MTRQIIEGSSNLAEIGYDAQAQALEVKFHSGKIARYTGVPQMTYEQIMESRSRGGAFNALVKARFPWSYVDEEAPTP